MKTEYNGIREKVLCAINSHAGILRKFSEQTYIGFLEKVTIELRKEEIEKNPLAVLFGTINKRHKYICSIDEVEIEISEQEFKEILVERDKQILEVQLEKVEKLCKNS